MIHVSIYYYTINVFNCCILARRARLFYRSKTNTLCDICEDEECGDICVAESKPQVAEVGKDSASKININWFSWLIAIALIAHS